MTHRIKYTVIWKNFRFTFTYDEAVEFVNRFIRMGIVPTEPIKLDAHDPRVQDRW